MRKLAILILALGITVVGCSTMTKEQKAAEAQRVENAIADSLAEGHFKIYANWMTPLRGGSRSISYGYYVKVDGDKFDSYLPYFGEVRYIPYGGGKGLNFESELSYCNIAQNGDHYEITLTTSNEEDTYLYYITLYPNGNSTILVRGRNRDSISYRGEFNTLPEK